MLDDARAVTAPDEHPGLQRARLRPKTETAIERLTVVVDRLIAVLDDIDVPAEDLEPAGEDEPSLGWSITGHGGGPTDLPSLDCEQDDSDREHSLGWTDLVDQSRFQSGQDDAEPSLGSIGAIDQTRWGDHVGKGWFATEGEEECEDEGADTGDDEPWLGATEGATGSQDWSVRPDLLDREVQCEDEGHDSDSEPEGYR